MKPSTRITTGARTLSRGLSWAYLLLATGLALPAHADAVADNERANALFKKGKAAYNSGKYEDALRINSEAWSLKKSPDIAANLAQAEAELGKHRAAAEHFAFALAHMLASSSEEQKQSLADGLAVEKKEIGSLRVTLEPADSVLTIDDVPIGLSPDGDVFVEPGEHQASVTHEGYETHRETLNVSKGGNRVLWIKLQPLGASANAAATPAPAPEVGVRGGELTPPPAQNEKPQHSLVPAFVGGGLTVAGVAVGVAFLLSGNASQRDADAVRGRHPEPNSCGRGTPYAADCAELHRKNSDIDSARRLEVVGFAVAGAAAIGTAAYLLWRRSASVAASSWSPTFSAAPGTASLTLTGQF